MKTFNVNFMGSVAIEADSEDEAYEIFEANYRIGDIASGPDDTANLNVIAILEDKAPE